MINVYIQPSVVAKVACDHPRLGCEVFEREDGTDWPRIDRAKSRSYSSIFFLGPLKRAILCLPQCQSNTWDLLVLIIFEYARDLHNL